MGLGVSRGSGVVLGGGSEGGFSGGFRGVFVRGGSEVVLEEEGV